MLTRLLLTALPLACSDKAASPDSAPDSAAEPVTLPSATIQGTLTLEIDAHGAYEVHFPDCSFTFTFQGERELNGPWFCPSCDLIFEGEASVLEGEDCRGSYNALDDGAPSSTWTLQLGLDLEAGAVWMPLQPGGLHHPWVGGLSLEEGATIVLDAPLDVPSHDLPNAATYRLTGALEYTIDPDTQLVDPQAPRAGGPYACGWPRNNPGDLELDYQLAIGRTFPNLRLPDQCGEEVDLWDFHGSWLVISGLLPDYGDCEDMASQTEAALAALRADGYDVRALSLLGQSASAPSLPPSEETLEDWVQTHGAQDPVFADQGAAFALLSAFLLPYTGDGWRYPPVVVVDPEMKLVDGFIGFSDWDEIRGIIEQAAAE